MMGGLQGRRAVLVGMLREADEDGSRHREIRRNGELTV